MANIKNRIEKLERLQPNGFQHLSDDELNTRIAELCNKPQMHDCLANDINNDHLRLRVIGLMTLQRKNEY